MPGRGALLRKRQKNAIRLDERNAIRREKEGPEGDDDGGEVPRKRGPEGDADAIDPANLREVEPVTATDPNWVQVTGWVYVPALEIMVEEEHVAHDVLFQCIYDVVASYGAAGCSVADLLNYRTVYEAKQDPSLKAIRMLDVIKMHVAVFDALADSTFAGGWIIRIKPGALSASPDAPASGDANSNLPAVIENPVSDSERAQALRIYIIRSLHKRGGNAILHDVGQDAEIIALKKLTLGSNTFIKFVGTFVGNFTLHDKGNGNVTVGLLSCDVGDLSEVYHWAQSIVPAKRDKAHGKGIPPGAAKGENAHGKGKHMCAAGKGKVKLGYFGKGLLGKGKQRGVLASSAVPSARGLPFRTASSPAVPFSMLRGGGGQYPVPSAAALRPVPTAAGTRAMR